ncbi:tyrosine-type recombinase/integrase [Marinobacter goseongensis]|uniref:tyrosine-type recombinase/integrase n=1 Tax=Marinobacter goseongensis TaxID=453838 RepID=UPI0020044A6F|nr:site-specific integrase [Marinobacter goseongensis]MCK7553301.1 site-specific integrase [Marinobacter goseongensis]
MTRETDTEKSVEPFEADNLDVIPADKGPGKMVTLPWEAPAEFRTVPGHAGKLRTPDLVGWKANSDAEAVAVWLAEKASGSPHTATAYRKEAERFLFWLADQGMTISDATREDYLVYARFLLNPQPADRWQSGIRIQRSDPRWRPFEKPLSPGTAKQSLTIIKSLISYLHTKGWLLANPMPDPKNLISAPKRDRADLINERQIPPHLMAEFIEFCSAWSPYYGKKPITPGSVDEKRIRVEKARLMLIVDLASVLAARSSDILAATCSDFYPAPPNSGTDWLWRITSGKGNKSAVLPVPKSVIAKLSNLRIQLGLTALPKIGEPPYPIAPDTRSITLGTPFMSTPPAAISRSRLYKHLKEMFVSFSESILEDDPSRTADAQLMRNASTHFLRHTAIKAVTLKTNSLTTAQRLARHSNINTTADYAKTTLTELAVALNE